MNSMAQDKLACAQWTMDEIDAVAPSGGALRRIRSSMSPGFSRGHLPLSESTRRYPPKPARSGQNRRAPSGHAGRGCARVMRNSGARSGTNNCPLPELGLYHFNKTMIEGKIGIRHRHERAIAAVLYHWRN